MKTAIITGGSSGIGEEIVKKFLENEYRVIATYNKTTPKKFSENLIFKQVDLSDNQSCESFIEYLRCENIYPSVLVNNAGIVKDTMFHKMKLEDWENVLKVNLLSLFYLTQPIFTMMREMNYGRIINISSVNANKGQVGQVNYCAAKAGIQGFTRALALEGAKFGITVNTVSPGYTDTSMMKGIRQDILDDIIEKIPMKRLGMPDEIAESVFYLASEASKYITGTNLEINGGLYFS